jgi:hypothetical protein
MGSSQLTKDVFQSILRPIARGINRPADKESTSKTAHGLCKSHDFVLLFPPAGEVSRVEVLTDRRRDRPQWPVQWRLLVPGAHSLDAPHVREGVHSGPLGDQKEVHLSLRLEMLRPLQPAIVHHQPPPSRALGLWQRRWRQHRPRQLEQIVRERRVCRVGAPWTLSARLLGCRGSCPRLHTWCSQQGNKRSPHFFLQFPRLRRDELRGLGWACCRTTKILNRNIFDSPPAKCRSDLGAAIK